MAVLGFCQIWAKMPQPPRAEILVQCIVTQILMLPAIKQLSSYRSVKKSTFGGFLLKIFPRFDRTGQKAPRVTIITAAGSQAAAKSVLLGKGKPRDLDYPAFWTGARRCGAEIWHAALSASPPECKNSGTAGIELPQMSLVRLIRISLTIRPSVSLLSLWQHFIWIWFLREFVLKKRLSPASADELRMLRTHRRGVCMLSNDPRG